MRTERLAEVMIKARRAWSIPKLLAVALVLCWLLSCAAVGKDPGAVDGVLRQLAAQVVTAFGGHDGSALAALVHPDKGGRFSPSAYVDLETDRVVSRDRIARLWQDTQVYQWGYAEGSGDPIALTAADYLDRYVSDRPYAAAGNVLIDSDRTLGTTVNNAATVYPLGRRVEYLVTPPEGQGDPNDWGALRLVFEPSGDRWYLVGVIHDTWSP